MYFSLINLPTCQVAITVPAGDGWGDGVVVAVVVFGGGGCGGVGDGGGVL